MTDHLGLAAKREHLRSLAQGFGLKTFVETGIFERDCSALALRDVFETLHVIDPDEEGCRAVMGGNVCAWPGDSAVILPALLGSIGRPAFFWLDAHYWPGHPKTPTEPLLAAAPRCPLVAELTAIREWEHGARSVVLVDDVRQLGAEPGRPPLDAVLGLCYPFWRVTLAEDIVHCYPHPPGAS